MTRMTLIIDTALVHPELNARQIEKVCEIAELLRRAEAEVFENGATYVRAGVYVGCGQTVTGPVTGWRLDLSQAGGGWITLGDYTGELITQELSQVSEHDVRASWDRI